MKIRKLANLRPIALVALGVFLGRGAQADTILDFEVVPVGQPNNGVPGVLQTFGDNASASSDGVTVSGFGTPNIGLTWGATGAADTRWDYYNDIATFNVWGGVGQLNESAVGTTYKLTFAPNSASARVVVKSFNLFPYYVDNVRYTYNVSVLAGTNVVSGPNNLTFISDATKNHPVSLNYTGALGQTLRLQITRVASTLAGGETEGRADSIAVDDIRFAQLPESALPPGPQVVSVTPADEATGVPAFLHPYSASITNGATAPVSGSIQLKLDGIAVTPPPTITSSGGLTNVTHPGTNQLTSGDHVYTLIYTDNGAPAATYTNEVLFHVNYATLPTTYALPPGAGVIRGFTYRTVSASTESLGLASSIARAKAQLAGTLINTNTSLPYTNSATLGTNADGSFNIDTVINFDDEGHIATANFPDDVMFPGLELGFNNWFSTEALLYLELPAGYYRLGVNSDDGFECSALPPQGVAGAPIVLGAFDNGRASANTLFDLLVQTSGIYPVRLIYFENAGDANCELFSSELTTNVFTLINDTNAAAIKSYRVLKPRITSIVRSGANAVVNWAYGTPPFQVETTTNLTNPVWAPSGAPTSSRTANVPIQPGAAFIRVYGK
jgi:hypothetical protein